MTPPTIEDVRAFWNSNPLWTGESKQEPGSRAFFDEHRRVCIKDCFGGRMDERIFPADKSAKVLDLGCGIGFWLVEYGERGFADLHGADLVPNSIALAGQRLQHYGLTANLQVENAEQLTYADGTFDHVNCQGVVHHTPSPPKAVAEIARVLKPGGTASISVYYKNIVLRNWRLFSGLSRRLGRSGAKLDGRGREDIYTKDDIGEIVRLYDGKDNPIGLAYTRNEFREMLEPHFVVEQFHYHFFPARSLPFRIPALLHRVLDARLPFMIYSRLHKK